jgi:hypothetical protein
MRVRTILVRLAMWRPPIGNAAGLPVSATRLVQRIAEEWLT